MHGLWYKSGSMVGWGPPTIMSISLLIALIFEAISRVLKRLDRLEESPTSVGSNFDTIEFKVNGERMVGIIDTIYAPAYRQYKPIYYVVVVGNYSEHVYTIEDKHIIRLYVENNQQLKGVA